MEDKRTVYICLQSVGIVFGFIFVNDMVNERWFDAGLMLAVLSILLTIVARMSKTD